MLPLTKGCYLIPECPEQPFDCSFYHVTGKEISDGSLDRRHRCPYEWQITLNYPGRR